MEDINVQVLNSNKKAGMEKRMNQDTPDWLLAPIQKNRAGQLASADKSDSELVKQTGSDMMRHEKAVNDRKGTSTVQS